MCCEDLADEDLRWEFDARPDGVQLRVWHKPSGKVVSALQREGENIRGLKERALAVLKRLIAGESENP